tara:strand:+ start:91 stop:429 length:339 start_codon:yes stop_codon:yes gene_type:complete
MANGCLFCKILRNEIPADLVYEDDTVIAFRDITPQAPVHVLMIPRKHVSTLNDLDDPALAGHLLMTAKKLAKELKIDEKGYRLVMNCNEQGGQTVFHIHMHILGGQQFGHLV